MRRLTLSLSLAACAACTCSERQAPPSSAAAPGAAGAPGLTVGTIHYELPRGPAPATPPTPALAPVAPVEVSPQPVTGTVRQAPGWKYFQKMFASRGTGKLLEKQGVVVDGNEAFHEFFELYEKNRYRPLLLDQKESADGDTIKRAFVASIPSVVTSDVVLHNLHLFFDFALARAEETRFSPELAALLDDVAAEARGQSLALAGTAWADAARDDVAFLAVARALLKSGALKLAESHDSAMGGVSTDEQVEALRQATLVHTEELVDGTLPPDVRALAKQELARVVKASGVARPALFDYPGTFKDDASQYAVRGHYVKSPALQAYFRTVMWLSRMAMSFHSERATRSAVLLSLAVSKGEALPRWRRLDEATRFLAGPPDDVTFEQMLPVLATAGARLDEAGALSALQAKLRALPPPRVQGVANRQAHGPALAETMALHFFSQRTVLDAEIFQGLVDPQVPNKTTVLALEVPAVLGSELARKLVDAAHPSDVPEYRAQLSALSESMPKELAAEKGRQLYAGWMDALGPLLEPVPEGFPAFMRSDAFPALRLETYLASYAQLKHDTVLYAKQALAEMGGPGFEDKELTVDDRGYVVPEAALYGRVRALLGRLRSGLTERKLFPAEAADSYGRFERLVAQLETISRKELTGAPLDEADYHLIKFIGGDLEHFWEETLTAKNGLDRWQLLDENNAAVVADIFTGPDHVKHVASGFVQPVYVAFPRDGALAVGRGGVLAFYELNEKERLTDAQWREKLRKDRPVRPAWTRAVVSEDPSVDIRFFSDLGED